MSENGVMDRPRRSTRNSLASSSAGTSSSPATSNNPYKKPTYSSRGETPTSSKNTNGTPSSGRGRRGRGRPPGRNSSGGRSGSGSYPHTKPECIAVRVDGRRSTGGSTASSGGGRRGAATGGGRRSTYNSRQDYEYHYGSDFDSDQNESDLEEDEVESEPEEDSVADSLSLAGDNDNESDSDFSVSSTTRVTSSRLPSPPVPIWLDADKVPSIETLELPHSSDDLLLSREHVVKAVEIYEPLRRFYQLVRLSPFRFEDFCAALACEDQSSLLAEMHIQLLKCVIREEDSNGTLFGPNEVKDSVQAVVYFIDHITWPETIRSYLESDPAWKDVYDAMVSVEYPFCGPAIRIKVLGWLVDQFLTTNAVREQLLGDGTILHEDHCRACNRLGELICCESCPAVYHIECLNPPLKDPDNPPDMWKCPVCVKHQTPGVSDCTSEVEKMGLLIRHERLGYDRHGRKYWFLVRRILVESEDGSEVWYYSTRGQIEELLACLDSSNYESSLVENIKAVEDEIYRQIEVTEEVTRLQNTQRRKTYLDVENGKDMEADGPERMTRLKSTGLYKLGQENTFKSYANLFNFDPLAMSKGKQNEERDRKRHMSHKFSLTTASECKYGIKDLNGCTRQIQISALRGALTHMENVLPTTLMHVNWPMLRKSWLSSVQTGTCAADFTRAMLMISTCIRNAVYNPVWSESAGLVRFSRMTLLEREDRKKAEKRDKKDKDDEEDRLKAEAQFTKNPLPIRHQVYKQKGEEYRVHGRWGWIWLSNMRRCKPQDCREKGLLAGPHKHVIQVKNEMGKVKTMLIDPGVYCKLMAKRNLAVSNTAAAATAAAAKTEEAANDASPVAASVERSSSSEEKSESETTEPSAICTEDSSSSNNSNKENGGEVVEMKAIPEEDAKIQPSSSPEQMKVEDDEMTDTKVESKKPGDSDEATAQKQTEAEVQPKVEPMDVDSGIHTQSTESQDSEKPVVLNGEVSEEEEKGEEQQKQVESKDATEDVEANPDKEQVAVPNVENEIEAEKREESKVNEDMEVDQAESSESTEKIEPPKESTDQEKPCENGTHVSSEDGENQKQEPTANHESTEKTQASESSSVEESQGVGASAPPAVPTPVETKPEEGRKFKTELVNVSVGLASAHRILYPKIARRSDYLDTLLHRRLTLMSLEDKQLKSQYGDDMVAKAKQGLIQFEEEEKKRAQEAEEYPGEEVVDDNLTLGGAYAFCCYSSECRKEARDFMKCKGKNRERTYEKICYSPMCRLKFCLQETTRFKQERLREMEKEKYYKVYKEIEEKRQYTLEGTSHKLYMKKLPECLTVAATAAPASGGIGGNGPPTSAMHNAKKKPKTPPIKYPQLSSFRYATSKKQSILVLAPFELKRLSRTAGRQFTPAGFFPNQKSGSWGWSLPCGRPVFRTAWQYKTTHAGSLATAAMQLRILYASIRWDDILAKIPNNDGRHQLHTDTEIITTEILNHRIVGRFMERVQYLRRMQVVPIDAPKTIREITPSRIGLRKRKRAESPDKTEPVVTEDWVDEEKLELWEIRYYGDRIDRKHHGGGTSNIVGGIIGRFSDSNTPSTRTKSGIAIKQPEKYDPSHNPNTERRTYGSAHQQQQLPSTSAAGTVVVSSSSSIADTVDSTIEQVIRNHDPSKAGDKTVSAVKTAELMRETIETEMKMQRAVHLSKRDGHAKNGSVNNGAKPGVATATPPTASQQFQMQQNSAKGNGNGKNAVPGTPTSSKVGGVVVGKKFFSNRQSTVAPTSTTADGGILTKRPLQSTITINKGAGGTISVVKTNPTALPTPAGQPEQQQNQVPTTVAVTTLGGQPLISGPTQMSAAAAAALPPQKLSVIRLPDGRLQVKGLLPGQHCYQTPDGKIHVTVSAAHVQAHLQQQQQQQQQAAAKQAGTPVSTTNTATQANSTSVVANPPMEAQQQIIQNLVGSANPGTIQIVQGYGGQQFLIQQPASSTAQQTTTVIQQAQQQQQQVQIMMPIGQLGAGQPVLVKKLVKSGNAVSSPQTATSSTAAVVNKATGNVVQIATTAQNQLTQLLGQNKTLVRLDNNQLAAIQLPIPQQQQQTTVMSSTPVSSSPVSANKSPTVVQTTNSSNPAQQTTITRTPGLQISIVSPSKSKGAQPVKGTNSSSTVPQASPSSPSATAGSPKTSTPTTVIRVASPLVKSTSPAPAVATPPSTPQPQRLPSPLSTTSPAKPISTVSTSVLATKSAPPPIQVTGSSVVIGTQHISVPPSTQSPVITATKSQPPPIPQDATPIAVKSLPLAISPQQSSALLNKAGSVSTPIAVKSTPPAPETMATSSTPVPAVSPPNALPPSPVTTAPTTPKTKVAPSKLVAQILQTPQGPKVVIQGVNPGGLTQSQMMQLQAQIQKQQQQQAAAKQAGTPVSTTNTATQANSTSVVANPPMEAQQQIIQNLVGSANPGTIQIVQGYGGQQFLIQQPATSTSQQTTTLIQQAQQQQQQVQIMMPSGQFGAGQPVLVKKLVKSGNAVSSPQTATSSTSAVVNKATGNVVQIATTAQNQLTQLLGQNKTLVRLDNNQLAAIQLPIPQQQQQTTVLSGTPVSSSPVSANKSPTVVQTTNSSNPAQQTTITRTPGLPISIVSPSKSKGAQPVKGTNSSSTVPQASPSSPSTTAGSPKTSTPTTVIRVASPLVKSTSPAATKSQPPPIPQDATPIAVKSLPPAISPQQSSALLNKAGSVSTPIAVKSTPPAPETMATSSTPVPAVSPANALPPSPVTTAPTTPKTKVAPSKIVAQIFQTPQGPKVVIQGVNPGELTQSQMMQLQAQIQKQLAAQQQQPKPALVTSSPAAKTTPAVMPPASSAVVQTPQHNSLSSTPVHQPSTSTLPTILQSAKQQTSSSLAAQQHQSPVEVLRSAGSTAVSHSSPMLPRSPPPTTMVSPAKVLSPPSNLPTLLSPPKSVVARQDMVAALSSVREPSILPGGSPSAGQPVVARKSQPRKSPIRPNNLDSPPPAPIMSPPTLQSPVIHNNSNSVAMELMRPLDEEQQELLAEKRNALKEEIMEKKKAAATQMRLEAQREIQEQLDRQKALELAKEDDRKRACTMPNTLNDSAHSQVKGAKRRKMDHSVVESRNSTEEGLATPTAARTPSSGGNSANSHKGPRGRGGKRGGKKKLLCICKKPYQKDKFYIQCDKCDDWFHGDCIGITEEMSQDLPEYICDDCKDDKLYCMCRKPYNESQFYIQCDKCEDWFHGRCVGVVQGESDAIGDYSCPQCEPNSEINLPNGKRLDAADYGTLSRLLKEILANRSSQPFRKPVSKAQAPNYYAIIKEPMDLQTISNRVEDRQYERLREFIGDVEKIFENCRYYNDSTTDIIRHAENLEKFFVQKIWALRQNLNTRLQQVIP